MTSPVAASGPSHPEAAPRTARPPGTGGPSSAQLGASRFVLIAVGAYVGAQVISQVTSLKIGSAFGQAVDMGTWIYPITFTLRDVIHKVAGRRAARVVILTSAGVNLFLAAYLSWVASAPSDPSYPLGEEYEAVLGPIWRIVIASLLAMVVSELIDTEVYHLWVTRITRRHQWARVLVSNAISVPADNLIFALGAFAPLFFLSQAEQAASLPWDAVWEIFWINLWVKGLVSICSIPLIYLTKQEDQLDA